MVHPSFPYAALGSRVEVIADVGTASEVWDRTVQRIRVAGRPWRMMVSWRRIVFGGLAVSREFPVIVRTQSPPPSRRQEARQTSVQTASWLAKLQLFACARP